MKVERVADVVFERPDLWDAPDDGARIDFDSWGLMEQAGIAHDMAATNEEDYFRQLDGLAETLGGEIRVRAAPSMVGPAAGDGTPTFIDLFTQAKDWIALAIALRSAVKWLQRAGVGEMRVSERGIEALARWELRSRALDDQARLVDVKLIPRPPSPYTGAPPSYLGYLATFARDDGGMRILRFSLDGIFENMLDEDRTDSSGS